jgi:hypothetical protein
MRSGLLDVRSTAAIFGEFPNRIGWTNLREFAPKAICRGDSQKNTPLRLTKIPNCGRLMQPQQVGESPN